jgi:hypothetical protein
LLTGANWGGNETNQKGIGFFTAKLWMLNDGHDTGNNKIEVAVVVGWLVRWSGSSHSLEEANLHLICRQKDATCVCVCVLQLLPF